MNWNLVKWLSDKNVTEVTGSVFRDWRYIVTDVTHFIPLSWYITTISMTKGMIFRFALARSKKIMNDTSEYS